MTVLFSIAQVERYIVSELECRRKTLPVVCILYRQRVGRVLAELRNGEVSRDVQEMLISELGFDSWNQLTQAALSVDA